MNYTKLFLQDWYEHRWDDVYEKDHRMVVLWKNFIRFCNFTKDEVREAIKKYDIQYVIDEDNNNGLVQSIWSLYHWQPQYKIKICDKTMFDNHGSDDTINAVRNILLDIKKWERTVDFYLDLIGK